MLSLVERKRQSDKKYRDKNKDKVANKLKKWRAKNYDRAKARDREVHLKSTYGISFEDKLAMVKAQDGRCLGCAVEFSGLREADVCVDHCHKTGRVRGILCGWCNRGLGCLKDSTSTLENLIKYLERYT